MDSSFQWSWNKPGPTTTWAYFPATVSDIYPNGTDVFTLYVQFAPRTEVDSASSVTFRDSMLNQDDNSCIVFTTTNFVSSPLPIQLASFKAAILSSEDVSLNWTTISETNNYGFFVQRNGVDLKFIAGHGTTLQSHSYAYTDYPWPGRYQYRLKQVDLDGTSTLSEAILMDVIAPLPTEFVLSQNFPNPFNPTTEIAFSIRKESSVSLRVYDILGREVATLVSENRKPGQYTERFDGSRMASGVYMYVLRSSEGQLTSRMILSK